METDPTGLDSLGARFIDSLVGETTYYVWMRRQSHLEFFLAWCRLRRIEKPAGLTAQVIEEYQSHLYRATSPATRATLSHNGRYRRMQILSMFTAWLLAGGHIPLDPLAKVRNKARAFWAQTHPQGSLPALAAQYLQWMPLHGYAERTVLDARENLRSFLLWCGERELSYPSQVSKAVLERYQKLLYRFVSARTGQPLAAETRKRRIGTVKLFFAWLAKGQHVLYNPASEIELPRIAHRLPRDILTAAEIKRVLEQPDTSTTLGLRDRAILETLYATAIRRHELAVLALDDILLERGMLLVRQGKGKKDRHVPLTRLAVLWLDRYIEEARPLLDQAGEHDALFIGAFAKPLNDDTVARIVHRHIKAAGIAKAGSCQLLRHSVATLMLENGADVRYIQELLGHEHLQTTQIYTKVSISKLREVHDRTHPGRLKPAKTQETPDRE